MKRFLSICCLLLVAGLTISVVSPEFHSFFFHSNNLCPDADGADPCHSHGEGDEEEEQQDSCPVLLFSKSSEVSHFPIFLLEPALSVIRVSPEEWERVWIGGKVTSIWARGPPLRA